MSHKNNIFLKTFRPNITTVSLSFLWIHPITAVFLMDSNFGISYQFRNSDCDVT